MWCKVDVTPIIENRVPVRAIGVITDISNLKNRTDRLEREVKLDNFTGLYNKKYAIERIEDVMKKNPWLRNALILLDIDHFKSFNDTYGHALGDEAIQLVADTLKLSFRKTDVVGRLGGDEFIVFVPNIPGEEGAAVFPEDAADFNELFAKADEALYQAKLYRENYVFSSGWSPED